MIHIVIILSLLHLINGFIPVKGRYRNPTEILRRYVSTENVDSTNKLWWHDGLKFSCTGCGKCCQNEGEVWFDTDEFYDLCVSLKLSFNQVIDQYVELISSGWIKIKNKYINEREIDQCIFLDQDGKSCTVYENRPIQCRTYPYWPNLLINREAWDNEAVVPEHVLEGKHWSQSQGGCEGINHSEAPMVPITTIQQNHDLYKKYGDSAPLSYTFQSPTDLNRLLVKLDVIQGVSKSTLTWIDTFMKPYQLYPYTTTTTNATSPSSSPSSSSGSSDSSNCSNTDMTVLSKLRHRVFLGSEIDKIHTKLNYEVLALMTEKAEDVSSIMITLPFAFQEYEAFESFVEEWEALESRKYKTEEKNNDSKKPRSSLRDRLKRKQSSENNPNENLNNLPTPSYEVTFFHPQFLYNNEDDFQESTADDEESDDDDDEDDDDDIYDYLNDSIEIEEEGEEDEELIEEFDDDIHADYIHKSPFPVIFITRIHPSSSSSLQHNPKESQLNRRNDAYNSSIELLQQKDINELRSNMERCLKLSID